MKKSRGVSWAAALVLLTTSALSVAANDSDSTVILSHAIAMHGDLQYGEDFEHFEYVNPEAPKGGQLRLHAIGTFDSLNPFITRGTPASQLSLIYETLMTSSQDEPFSMYGLIAEAVEYPEDRSWVIYHLNPKARFHDGKAITASDVVFSFNLLRDEGAPHYGYYYADVSKVEALDDHRVKFSFGNPDNQELALIVGQIPVLPEHFWKDKEFNRSSLERPLGSGPYRIANVDAGRSITYERVDNYWGKDLPVNRGMYNFDRIRIDYYRDDTVAVEAIKAGEYDVRRERIARSWHSAYDTPAASRGDLIREEIRDYSPRGMQAFILNTRRAPFDNPKFRRALNYAFDFEWANRNLFHDGYNRVDSYFFNSELASSGLPEGRELEILKPFKDQLPESVFTEPYRNPVTDGSGTNRENLRKAQALLREAGFRIRDGRLIDPDTDRQVRIEFLDRDASFERIVNPYIRNLNRLGIEARSRTVDTSQYINRVQSFDFDVTTLVLAQSQSPGNEQRDYWSSGAAEVEGSRNYGGINNPVIDQLIELIINAPNRDELVTRTRALDRVLLHNHYVVPQWNLLYHRLVYWDKFGKPELAPRYDSTYSTGLMTWWYDTEKAQRLERRSNR